MSKYIALLLLLGCLLSGAVATASCADGSSATVSTTTDLLKWIQTRQQQQISFILQVRQDPSVRLIEVRISGRFEAFEDPYRDYNQLYNEPNERGVIQRPTNRAPVYRSATNQAIADTFDQLILPTMPRLRRVMAHYQYYPVRVEVLATLDSSTAPLPRRLVVFLPPAGGTSASPLSFDRALLAGRLLPVDGVSTHARLLLGLDATPSTSGAGLFALVGEQRALNYDISEFSRGILPGTPDQMLLHRFLQLQPISMSSLAGYLYPHFFGPYESARAGFVRLWSDPQLSPEDVFPVLYAPVSLPTLSASSPRQATPAVRLEAPAP